MMSQEELQESLDRWHRNHPESILELEEEMKNRNPRGIQSEEEFKEIMNEIKELKRISDEIAIKYGLKNEKMD